MIIETLAPISRHKYLFPLNYSLFITSMSTIINPNPKFYRHLLLLSISILRRKELKISIFVYQSWKISIFVYQSWKISISVYQSWSVQFGAAHIKDLLRLTIWQASVMICFGTSALIQSLYTPGFSFELQNSPPS